MDNICSQFSSFEAHIGGIGSFPSSTYIRVVWLGMKAGSQALSAISEALDIGLGGLGIAKSDKKFTPHLTLGRNKGNRSDQKLVSLVKDLENTDIGIFKVDKIVLFESKLTPEGPIYNEIHAVNLG